MGMYTELHYNVELKKDVPEEILAVLKSMLNWDIKEPSLPDHGFFSCERWRALFSCDSYYFHADTHSTLRFDNISHCYYLCIRANLKNYDGEIEAFLKWVEPYVYACKDDFLGFYRYEECENPTLIFYGREPMPVHCVEE